MRKAIAVVLAIAGMASAASAFAGNPNVVLGTIPFPPGPSAVPIEISLNAASDVVTATPMAANPYMGAPREFPYNGATGKGFELVNALAVPFQVVNETSATPGVIFWEYVSTGTTYGPRAFRPMRGTKASVYQGYSYVDGIWIQVTVNYQNGTPDSVSVTPMGTKNTLTAPVYAQSGMAPFILGSSLYTVKPLATKDGSKSGPSFMIEKWMLYSDNTTNGIFTAGYPFPLP